MLSQPYIVMYKFTKNTFFKYSLLQSKVFSVIIFEYFVSQGSGVRIFMTWGKISSLEIKRRFPLVTKNSDDNFPNS